MARSLAVDAGTAAPVHAAPHAVAEPARIRAFAAEDAPAVAQLVRSTFYRVASTPLDDVSRRLSDTFLNHPWAEPDLPSLVYEGGDGAVRGFLGCYPLRLTLRGRSLRGAVASCMTVADHAGDPLAGVRLLRAFTGGPQDLSLTETSNALFRGLWMRAGGIPTPAYSMTWLRVFRPARFALTRVENRLPAVRWTRPVAALGDRIAAKLDLSSLRPPAEDAHVTALDAPTDALIDCARTLTDASDLRPAWDDAVLAWLLGQAETKARYGAFIRRIVHDRRGRGIGAYLYHGRAGDIAHVLQIFAEPAHAAAVTRDLLRHADAAGCVAVRGRTQPWLLDALLTEGCVMLQRSFTMVHSRSTEVLETIQGGQAFLNGLAGEGWTPLIGNFE
jgi:hypothetical protein